MNTDTPLPPEEPAGENPPDGAVIDYYLNNNADEVQLNIFNDKGTLIRSFSNKDTLYSIPPVNIPLYWIRPQQILSASSGAHRFLWDMKYSPLNVPVEYPMTAVKNNTAPSPTAPWVMPGNYTVKLTVNNKLYTQNFTVKMDPRVKTPMIQLQKQHDLSVICYEGSKKSMTKFPEIARKFNTLFEILVHTDMPPTKQTEKAVLETQQVLLKLISNDK
jgi:hypothetical protein